MATRKVMVEGALSATWPEQLATVLGVLFVWLAMRESLWNFPVGLVQAAIFGWVCFTGRLYSETVLNAVYFVAMIYGWWHWSRGGKSHQPLAVQRLTAKESAAWVAATLLLWGIWGWGMANFTPAGATPRPLSPNTTVTGLFTLAPLFGLMM